MIPTPPAPLRLRLDGDALVSNWRFMARRSGSAACGAAVKADGYGLGAVEVVRRLAAAGCRDFFVAIWAEAAALMPLPEGTTLSVLHGVREEDMPIARALAGSGVRPVLNTPAQVARWKAAGGGPCDVMVDTGMNRLGLSAEEASSGLLDGLEVETLHSHLACADEDSPMNARQLAAFAALGGRTPAKRMSLANSAGILLGPDYAFDLTRPGLALYGGIPRDEAREGIRPVVSIEAQVLQVRDVRAGETVGYNATWTADRDTRVAIVNLGYADGYLRAFSSFAEFTDGEQVFSVAGRISMDLTAINIGSMRRQPKITSFQAVFDLFSFAELSGCSQYEILVRMSNRYERSWNMRKEGRENHALPSIL